MKIEDDDDALMVVAAARYCLRRKSYIVSTCVRWLKTVWYQIGVGDRKIIVEDITNALQRNAAGDATSTELWTGFLEWALSETGPSQAPDSPTTERRNRGGRTERRR